MAVTNFLLINKSSLFQVSHGIKTMMIYCLFDGYNMIQFSNDLFSSRKALKQQSEIEAF